MPLPPHLRSWEPRIEALEKPLGKGLYRGLLKTVARVWTPSQVRDLAVLRKLLGHMQAAERGLRRLEPASASYCLMTAPRKLSTKPPRASCAK
jgi:hypothetical protein